jgi:signal transduction histidine kinase
MSKWLATRQGRWLVILFSLMLSGALLIWALTRYQLAPTTFGMHTVAKLILLSVLLALAGRTLLGYMLRTENPEMKSTQRRAPMLWRPVFLLDLNAPIYLAVAVLTNVPASVLTVLITQVPLQIYTALRGLLSWTEACYRVAGMALLVLISGKIYKWISGPPRDLHYGIIVRVDETKEVVGATIAAVAMLLLIIILFAPMLVQLNRRHQFATWRTYLVAPMFFQGLILSMGPLLPIMDVFGSGVAEFTWVLFLGPLFAIYYLALINTRMNAKTYALQRTLQELGDTRKRRDQLSSYASLITRAQEDERRRLARELHDDTAQSLIALSLGLDGMEKAVKKLHPPPQYLQWFTYLRHLADDTLEGVRRACQDLRPSILDNLGLHAALEWLSDGSATRGIPCTFTCSGSPQPLSPEAEIAIFRIVQEALSNIWRHSHATQASIELRYLPKLLHVTVCDNGKGFVAREQSAEPSDDAPRSLGLVGMRERALLIGATLTIDTSPEEGSTVSLFLPL